MPVQVEELEPCRVALHIEIAPERVSEVQEKAFTEVAPHVTVPGFRRGKAPKNLIQRYMNQDILRQHTLSLIVPQAVEDAIKEADLKPWGEPEVAEEPTLTPGEPLKFTATLTTSPTVELGEYTGMTIEHPTLDVGDEDVERAIEQLLQSRASLTSVERPVQEGDFVTIDYVAHVEGEDDQSGPMLRIPGSADDPIDKSLLGHSAGDTYSVEAPLHTDETKPANYDITLKDVRNWGVPELTEELAQELGYETIESMRANVRARIQAQADTMMRDEVEQRLVNALREGSTLVYPKVMVEQMAGERLETLLQELEGRRLSLDHYLEHEKITLIDLEANMMEQAKGIVESQLLLSEIAKAQDLQVTQQELAEALGAEEAPEATEEAVNSAANRILYRKIMEFLVENNEIHEQGAADGESSEGAPEGEVTGEPKKSGLMSRLFRRKSAEAQEETSIEETPSDTDESTPDTPEEE